MTRLLNSTDEPVVVAEPAPEAGITQVGVAGQRVVWLEQSGVYGLNSRLLDNLEQHRVLLGRLADDRLTGAGG